ncbi:MAG: hypothetical protein ABI284_06025 [Nitrosospira sp.]
MDLTTWTEAELVSIREKLLAWRLQRESPTWGNRFLNWNGLAGAFALLTGLMDMFFGGVGPTNFLLIMLGSLACFTWYKGEKQRKKNISFFEEVDRELSRRGHKF